MKMLKYLLLFLTLISLNNCKEKENTLVMASAKLESNISNNKQVQAILKISPTIKTLKTSSFQKTKIVKTSSNSLVKKEQILFGGPVLENDLIAYRQNANPNNQISVFGKKVSAIVMDTITKYPFSSDQNWGVEILKPGHSLGIGSPMIHYQDSLYTLAKCEQKTIEIIEENLIQSTVRTTFKNLSIGSQKIDIIQDWSMNAHQFWCEIQLRVVNGNLPVGAFFASGFKKCDHKETSIPIHHIKEARSNGCLYMYSWGKPSDQQDHIGLAIIIDEEYQPEKVENSLNHIYRMNKTKQQVHYRFMAAWQKGVSGIKDANTFERHVKAACQNL